MCPRAGIPGGDKESSPPAFPFYLPSLICPCIPARLAITPALPHQILLQGKVRQGRAEERVWAGFGGLPPPAWVPRTGLQAITADYLLLRL